MTALTKETVAVEAMVDNAQDFVFERRRYRLGSLPAFGGGSHYVVVLQAAMGNNIAALRAAVLLRDFPNVKHILMVGIAAGVPYPADPEEHVRLGDVVVSNERGVIQYDFVRETSEGVAARPLPRPPSASLLEAARALEAAAHRGQQPWVGYLERARHLPKAKRPGARTDILTDPADPQKRIRHPRDARRIRNQPRVFLGPIGSANTLLRNAAHRDQLARQFGVKAIEMEGSGLADAAWEHEAGYLIVRGICDYGDGNKTDLWQGYAAVAAAAYTRGLIEQLAAPAPPPGPSTQDAPAEPGPSVAGVSIEAGAEIAVGGDVVGRDKVTIVITRGEGGQPTAPEGPRADNPPTGDSAQVDWLRLCFSHQARALLAGSVAFDQQVQRAWEACLRAWPTIEFWRAPVALQNLPEYLKLPHNPFGASRAEADPLVLMSYHKLAAFRELEQPVSTLAYGPSGSGKTAAAIALAWEALQAHFRADPLQLSLFPVYCPLDSAFQVSALARSAARTLLSYLLAVPEEFNRLTLDRQADLGRLLNQYLARGDTLAEQLKALGFVVDQAGQQVLDEVGRLTEALPAVAPHTDAEILRLLAAAQPFRYAVTLLLLDGAAAGSAGVSTWLPQLSFLAAHARPASLIFKVFVPAAALAAPDWAAVLRQIRQEYGMHTTLAWQWEPDDLRQLLSRRLDTVREDSLASWCDYQARGLHQLIDSPDSRLVAAARGTPARLIERGNALLARIAASGQLLSRTDLDEIFGQPRET